jgi:hypothetical protein
MSRALGRPEAAETVADIVLTLAGQHVAQEASV